MKILLDTNIVIDIFTKRIPYYEHSFLALSYILGKRDMPIIPAGCITDIYYIISKLSHKENAKAIIEEILDYMIIVDTTKANIIEAINSSGKDFEDNVLISTAKKNQIDYILTRNIKDFEHSKVKAVTPKQFLKEMGKENLRVQEETLDIYEV